MPEFNVLIVDDSPFMRKVFSDVIDGAEAFKVLATASNGKEAVDMAQKLRPDIITMDLEMPQMNGLEALKRIMAVHPTPVIMLSAVTDNGTRDTIKALQYGAFDFIRKPDGAVNLDIRQVGEQLVEKLHIAVETMRSGKFKMMPAVEEKAPAPAQDTGQPESPLAPSPKQAEPKPLLPAAHAPAPARPAAPPPSPVKPKDKPAAPARGASPPAVSGPKTPADSPEEKKPKAAAPKPALPKPSPPKTAAAAAPKAEAPSAPAKPAEEKAERQPPKGKRAGTASFSQVVAIGTSTGGPRALHEVLTNIPADFPAPILVVQHMPPKFTHSLAQRLDTFSGIRVTEAVDGELVESATAYIAPGGYHMTLVREPAGTYRIKLTEDPPKSGHRPSVDVLFESLVGHAQLRRHAVLMTGMGSDGAKGMKALREDGAATLIAEAEQTCVVYGMPRSAVELGAASHVLPLQEIAPAVTLEVIGRKAATKSL